MSEEQNEIDDYQKLMSSDNNDDVTKSEYTMINGVQHHGSGTMSVSSATFNLVNTIIGSGFLTLPYNFKLNGWLGGTLQMVAMSILSIISLFQLIDVSTNLHVYQYFSIAKKLYNSKTICILISLINIVNISGALISYATVIQQSFFWWTREKDNLYIQLTYWCFILALVFPLSSLKNLNILHFASYFTILVVMYIVGVTITYFFSGEFVAKPPVVYTFGIQSLTTLSLFQNAFACHMQIANVYRDLQRKTQSRMRRCVVTTTIIVFVFYYLTAMFGYFTFTYDLRSNLLNVFAIYVKDAVYIQLANIFMLVLMVAHYPPVCFCLRRAVESLIWQDEDPPTHWRVLIALCIIIICSLIGSFVKEIADVLDYTASVAGACTAFIFPGLYSIKLYKIMGKGNLTRAIFGYVTLVTGVFVMITGLTCTIYFQATRTE